MKVHVYTKVEGEDFIMELPLPEDRARFVQRLPLMLEDSEFDIAMIYDNDETTEYTTVEEFITALEK